MTLSGPGSTVASKNGGDPHKPPGLTGIHGDPIGDPGRPFHPIAVLVAFRALDVTPASSCEAEMMPQSRPRQVRVLMRLVDGGQVGVEGRLGDHALVAEVGEVEQHCPRMRRQEGSRRLAVHLGQRPGAEIHKALPLAAIGLLG
jgi:hypothetical protein